MIVKRNTEIERKRRNIEKSLPNEYIKLKDTIKKLKYPDYGADISTPEVVLFDHYQDYVDSEIFPIITVSTDSPSTTLEFSYSNKSWNLLSYDYRKDLYTVKRKLGWAQVKAMILKSFTTYLKEQKDFLEPNEYKEDKEVLEYLEKAVKLIKIV